MSKILETVINQHIQNYLQSNNLMPPNSSCLLKEWVNNYTLVRNWYFCQQKPHKWSDHWSSVLLDMSVAFNSVDARIKIPKLQQLGLCQSCKIWSVLWQSPPVPAVATLVFWSWHPLNWRQLTCLATHCSNDLIICVAPADQSTNFWPGCNYGLILLIGMMRGWHQFVWLEVNLYMLVDDSLQNLWHGAEQSNRSPVTQSSQIPTKLSFQCISAYLLPLPICKYL